MDTPIPTVAIVIAYISWVMVIGPIYMRDRKPFQLKNTLIYYNAFQVLISSYMFYEHLMAGWGRGYSYTCQTVDYTDSPLSRRVSYSYNLYTIFHVF